MKSSPHCTDCGYQTSLVKITGDKIKRDVCGSCGFINYKNPKIIVGSLPVLGDEILLCKRSINPSIGKWTIPSGYMEMGESLEDGARREAMEEANLKFLITKLYGTYSIPEIGQVLFVYLVTISNNDFEAKEETLEVKLFHINEIPWNQIAFPSVEYFLRHYVEDKKLNIIGFHSNYAS